MQKLNGYSNIRNVKQFKITHELWQPRVVKSLDAIIEEQISKSKFFDQQNTSPSQYYDNIPEAQRTEYQIAPRSNTTEFLKKTVLEGKKLRPVSMFIFYDGLGGDMPYEIIKTGDAVEIEHVASKVHDDTIDRTKERNGMPSVWGYYFDLLYIPEEYKIGLEYEQKKRELEVEYQNKIKKLDEPQSKRLAEHSYKERRKELHQNLEGRLHKLWDAAFDEGRNKAGLFSQYLVSLSREILNSAKFPYYKLKYVSEQLENAHKRLVLGVTKEYNLRNFIKEHGLDNVSYEDYLDIAQDKSCLFNLANLAGARLAMGQIGTKENRQLSLVDEFSTLETVLLQISDDGLVRSGLAQKDVLADIRNGEMNAYLYKLYRALERKGDNNLTTFNETYGKNNASKEDCQKLVNMLENFEVNKEMGIEMRGYVSDSKYILNQIEMKRESKEAILGALEIMISRKV